MLTSGHFLAQDVKTLVADCRRIVHFIKFSNVQNKEFEDFQQTYFNRHNSAVAAVGAAVRHAQQDGKAAKVLSTEEEKKKFQPFQLLTANDTRCRNLKCFFCLPACSR